MSADQLSGQALQLLERYFELPEDKPVVRAVADRPDQEQARQYLTTLLIPIINKMLNESFDQLLNTLYRIDLPERQVMSILEKSPPDEIASRLSEAIADRQLEKLSLRERFREPGD